ncbi:MAG: alpha/beta fold hydrolase [Steroidobacteraceae bacterium]|nr:alpha/beta fold hydrolase [Steroidobacteraceae bacterium]
MTHLNRFGRWLAYLAGFGATVLATIVFVYALQARVRLPDLQAWHRITLEEEFRATAGNAPASFDEYQALEERLFAELEQRVLDDPEAADTQPLGRYTPGSLPARMALDTPWNRSYELAPEGEPRGAVLLVHGLTDSPYAMRAVAGTFRELGFHVVALRMPGHGTLPSALVDVRWEDWYAAVELAARHAAGRAGEGNPLYAGGFSTGAALVTLYAVRAIENSSLPRVDGLYLLSPAIGISEFAVLTNVLAGLSFIPAFEKSDWMDVLPEYDPYKYNSFPVNAANQIYRLTKELDRGLDEAEQTGRLGDMPRVLAFQSIVDSTITAREVVRRLLGRLPPGGGHGLVVFDVNQRDRLRGLIAPGPIEDLEKMRQAVDLPFSLTLVGNRSPESGEIAEYTRNAGQPDVRVRDWMLRWPAGVFSLGHTALPFAADDPLYGLSPPTGTGFNLGAIAARGEAGALVVPLGMFARIRSNPFFEVIRARIRESVGVPEAMDAAVETAAP